MKPRVSALAFALVLPLGISLSLDAPLGEIKAAAASVSVTITLDDLVGSSSYVVVATASDRRSLWEDTPGGRRIVTYTKLSVDRSVVGSPASEIWVRTLGGSVGNIGQIVSGEAQIATGSKSLLFLRKASDTAVVVTAMAQGHYPLVAGDGPGASLKLAGSPDAGTLIPRRGPSLSARERLVGATLDEALAAVRQVRRAPNENK